MHHANQISSQSTYYVKHFVAGLIVLLSCTGVFANDDGVLDEVTTFDIPDQPLDQALLTFSKQAGVQIVMAADTTRNLDATAIEGVKNNRDALEVLLDNHGLKYTEYNGRTIAIAIAATADEGEVNSDSKNLSQTPVLMAQATTSKFQASQSDEQGSGHGTFSGRVFDGLTDSALSGALVRIVETGQSTKTDRAGRFYFPSVKTGDQTLYISFLGFPSTSTKVAIKEGENANVELGLGQFDEIIVTGIRSARALALNQERTAANSTTVMSSDTLGNFTGTTLSEALRHTAGVSFLRDSTTGEGKNIIIRGLGPDYNEVLLNGISLPTPAADTRAPDLDMLAGSIDSITIHKTLLPSHLSGGTGGLVEIKTKTPLDRPARFASFSIESGGTSDGFRDDRLFSGTVSRIFGSDQNIGLSASFQQRNFDVDSIAYSSGLRFGLYRPLGLGGQPAQSPSEIDPLRTFPFESAPGAGSAYPVDSSSRFTTANSEDSVLTLSAEWQVAAHTNLTADWQASSNKQESLSRVANFRMSTTYQLMPVQALGGEERYTLFHRNDEVSLSQDYNYDPEEERRINVFSLRGETIQGPWSLNYTLGFSEGERNILNSRGFSMRSGDLVLDPAAIQPEAVDPVEGRIVSLYEPRSGTGFPLPLLTDAGWNAVNDPGLFRFGSGRISSNRSNNDKKNARLDVKYEFDHPNLKYLQSGVYWSDNKSFSFNAPQSRFRAPLATLSTLGLGLSESALDDVGVPGGFDILSERDMIDFMNSWEALADADPDFTRSETELHPQANDAFRAEEGLSAYLEAQIDIGKLEIIGGVRFNRTKLDAAQLRSPQLRDEDGEELVDIQDELTTLAAESSVANELLPRIGLNYRQTDNLIFRFGYYLSLARPSLSELSRAQSIGVFLEPEEGPNFDQPSLFSFQGNPDLKPASTDNYDFSVQYYHDQIGVMSFSAFYKEIDNLVESSVIQNINTIDDVTLPDHPFFQNLPDNMFVEGVRPINSPEKAHLWGYEARLERQLTFLPGAWSGLGLYLNYSFADSEKTTFLEWPQAPVFDIDGNVTGTEERVVPLLTSFDGSPEQTGTMALTYNKYGIDSSLAFTFQKDRVGRFEEHGLHSKQDGLRTLDLRASYAFDYGKGNYRVYLLAEDLLRDNNEVNLGGEQAGFSRSGKFIGGRSFRVGFGGQF